MIDTAQIALNRLYPGWKTFHCATLGHFFSIEIRIEEFRPGFVENEERRISVSISLNKKFWKKTVVVNNRRIEVLSKFIGANKRLISVIARIKGALWKK